MQPTGLIGPVFDLSFKEFVTTRIIKVLYVLMLVVIGLGTLVGIGSALVTMFTQSFFGGLVLLIVTPIVSLIYVLLARAWTEIIIVMFRIAENTTELVRLKQADGGSA